MKNSNDTIGNRSRDLSVCSAVPQPLLRRVPHFNIVVQIKTKFKLFLLTYLYNYTNGVRKISSVAVCSRTSTCQYLFISRILYKEAIFNKEWKLSQSLNFPVFPKFMNKRNK
jgi:hypothetical protein